MNNQPTGLATQALPLNLVEFDIGRHTFQKISLNELDLQKNKIYWIHCDLNHPDDLITLAKKFNLPEHVLQLCREENSIPKVMDDGESLTLQTECLKTENFSDEDVAFANLILYLTPNFCFTAASEHIPALFNFNESYPKAVKYAKTPCFILFLILDNVINDYSKLLLDFEELADHIDLEIRDSEKIIYNDVMAIKKQVMKIQHHIASIRDILMRISGRKVEVISEACRQSLTNILDHSQIIFNEADAIREVLKNTLDQIDNALMQRMNSSMKVLTAFAAIFLPLSLVAGIYGMNFEWIPELRWKYGYFWALGLMLLSGLLLFLIFRRKKWF